MRGQHQENAAIAADVYLTWWRLAGVECAVAEAPVDWLRPVAPALSAIDVRHTPPVPAIVDKPRDLQAFQNWLTADSLHPEHRWPGRMLAPSGPADAQLMVLTDMPDPADMIAGVLLSDQAGALFDAMLQAIGLDRQGVCIAPLFFSRPPGGMVEAQDIDFAADRARALIAVARPRRLLILGDRTKRALLAANDGGNDAGLRSFNHDGGTVDTIATFHPRLLLTQPAARAECWRAMQCLIEDPIK